MPKRARDFRPKQAGKWRPMKSLADQLRHTDRWNRYSKRFRAAHPLCFDPYRVHYPSYEPSADVHHIISLAARPDLIYDEANCAAVCKRCHGRLEGAIKRGVNTRDLFKKGPAHA